MFWLNETILELSLRDHVLKLEFYYRDASTVVIKSLGQVKKKSPKNLNVVL